MANFSTKYYQWRNYEKVVAIVNLGKSTKFKSGVSFTIKNKQVYFNERLRILRELCSQNIKEYIFIFFHRWVLSID